MGADRRYRSMLTVRGDCLDDTGIVSDVSLASLHRPGGPSSTAPAFYIRRPHSPVIRVLTASRQRGYQADRSAVHPLPRTVVQR